MRRTYAELLGHSNFASLLQKTLDEGKGRPTKDTTKRRAKHQRGAEKAALT